MNESSLTTSRPRRDLMAVLTAMVCAFLLTFAGATPASAATAAVSGQQTENSTVFWATGRMNNNIQNRMSFYFASLSNGWNTSMVVGARNISGNTASFAKTGTIPLGTTGPFRTVATGSLAIPFGMFWLTTYVGWYGCPGCPGTWTGTLTYSNPYP